MTTKSTPFTALLSAYDKWIKEENPSASDARTALRALHTASLEVRLQGKRLSSVPLLLRLGIESRPAVLRTSLCDALPPPPPSEIH